LEVSVEDILQVIEVVVLRADGIVVGEGNSEAIVPAIVVTHGRSEVAIVLVEDGLEVPGTNGNVCVRIVAVASVRGALFGGDLHHADFGRTTSHGRVAAGFLEGDGCDEDGGDASLSGHALEGGEVWCASGEGVVVLLKNGGEVFVHEFSSVTGGGTQPLPSTPQLSQFSSPLGPPVACGSGVPLGSPHSPPVATITAPLEAGGAVELVEEGASELDEGASELELSVLVGSALLVSVGRAVAVIVV